MESTAESFLRLVRIMDDLREKCPWDKKQTIHSLRQLSIEELYELADAITEEDWKGIKEELGDLFLHLVFYAKIGTEQGRFTLSEVLDGISDKLVARHPHIYGEVTVRDEEDVKRNWERLKLKEGKKSVLEGVPVSLPALVKAMRLQEKAKQVGFEWDTTEQVKEKVEEETRELAEAVAGGDLGKVEEEWGDLLFSMVNYARFLKIDAENALEKTNKKFIRRFTRMEALAAERGKALSEMTLADMVGLWNEAKRSEQ
jgi:XTP/dITP diphosphohydrolase